MATNRRRRAEWQSSRLRTARSCTLPSQSGGKAPSRRRRQAVVIAFSSSGNVYLQEDPEFDPLLKRYLADPSSSVAAANSGVDGGEITAAKMSPSRRRESARSWGRGGYGEFGGGGCKSYEKRGEDA